MRFDNKVTWLIILNIVLYFVTSMISANAGLSNYQMFGLQKNLVLDYHQYYRIVTSFLTHGDIIHLGVNMIALNALAYPVIRFTDEKFSFIIYGIAALAGSIGVIMFESVTSLTVGSSGAIYGLFGVLIYFAIKQYRLGYNDLLSSMLPIIVINVIISFLPGVSLVGHLSGLIAGLIGSYIYDKHIKRRNY